MQTLLSSKKIPWEDFQSFTTDQKVQYFTAPDGRIFDILISQQFDRPLLEELIKLANHTRLIAKTKEGLNWLKTLLSHKRIMLYFVQPSTRTFLSFMNACQILGMGISEVRDTSTSSEVKGETPEDTIRTFSSYFDAIIMRHPKEGFAERASWVLNNSDRPIPIFNAGSGKDQHPTQAVLDIYTIHRESSGIDGKSIAMVGDLLRGRTVRSLSYLLTNYKDIKIYYVSPAHFKMREDIKSFLKKMNITYYEYDDLKKVLPLVDAVYMTRIQDEHDINGESKNYDYTNFQLLEKHLPLLKDDAIIMHPLPRRHEIEVKVDADPRAKYWRQERNGMWIRTAMLIKVFAIEDLVFNRKQD
ncbi:aspartate carbamoyltransferase [bacterium]|nr:aspartate carbamoyltransferase [bacterium]